MNNQDFQDVALGWDDPIEEDSFEFILLPEGEYDFTVSEFERERFEGSEKMIACNKAVITLKLTDPDTGQDVFIKENFFLTAKNEWKLSSFFSAIGQKAKGQRIKMNWNAVRGATGRIKLNHRTYTDKTGEKKTINNVKSFIPREPDPQYQPKEAQQTFTPGKF